MYNYKTKSQPVTAFQVVANGEEGLRFSMVTEELVDLLLHGRIKHFKVAASTEADKDNATPYMRVQVYSDNDYKVIAQKGDWLVLEPEGVVNVYNTQAFNDKYEKVPTIR